VTETTEVKIDVPVPAAQDGDAIPAFDAAGEAQVAAAKQLVEELKESGTLAELSESTHIPESSSSTAASSSKKRSLEKDDDDDESLGETLVDNRSFLSKIFRRKHDKKRKPTQASRETKALPASRQAPEIVVREEGENGEGRRWAAGFGLAVAVGATAAAPYLFG
jgi:hypothetical protein